MKIQPNTFSNHCNLLICINYLNWYQWHIHCILPDIWTTIHADKE